jgi:chromosome segregation ATPase
MIKKIIFWSLVVGAVVVAVNVVRPGALHTAIRRVHAKIDQQIPPEFELARIRDQIAQLTPDMYRNISRIAEEMVAVETLKTKVDNLTDKLTDSKTELAALTSAVESGNTKVNYGGRDIPVTQISRKLNACRNLERELAHSKKIYEAKKAGVDTARQQLAVMKEQKQQLEEMAAKYEAELKELALQQMRQKVQLDDSRLAEIKQSFEKLRERIDVARTTADLAEQFKADTLTAEKKPVATTDVVEEAREYLGTLKTDSTKK